VLDYGCAEGAITAVLGSRLGLNSSQIFGADVRTIASDGFTFIPLAKEKEICASGSDEETQIPVLPTLLDQSIDLITASMVFHHVIDVKKVLLELRRVISSR
jgi:hypothetical protein